MTSKKSGRVYSLPAANKKTELELKREAQLKAEAEQAASESDEALQAELLARQEALSKEESERRFANRFDLVELIRKDPSVFPIEIALWNILIEMVQPSLKMGILVKTDAQIQAEQWFSVIGKVILCGPAALEGKTQSGIELSNFTDGIKDPAALVGKYVIHQRHVGADIWFAPMPGKRLKVISATEILAVTDNPTMFMRP
jgi:hypothetical protein